MPALRRIWITRTRPQADVTADRLRAMGLAPIVEPVLATRPLMGASIDLGGVDAIAFTSGHAVRAFAALCPAREIAVFAVGDATGALARSAGFLRVASAGGDVAALVRTIASADPRPALVLNPTAAEPAADLGGLLRARGVACRGVAVYETHSTGLAAVPAGVEAILIHSPKAARIVADLVRPERARGLSVCAISAAAAAPLKALPFAALAVAAQPTDAGLLRLLAG